MMLAAPVTTGTAGLAVALAAGAVSIASPCAWPLIPGYLAYVSGVPVGETGHTRRVIGASALFVLGFAIVFTALGATASLLGAFLLRNLSLITKISGVFVVVMGLAMLGVFRLPFLYREKRFDLSRVRSGPAGAVPLGMAFAFGWTPCIGPVLSAIFALATSAPTVSKGALLLFVYSLGMGIPFLLFAFVYSRAGRTFGALQRHGRAMERTGGVLLVLIGLFLFTGAWQRLFAPLARVFSLHHWLV